MLLKRELTAERKLLLVVRVLDLLEKDYQDDYPDEPPIIDGGYEKLMKKKLLDASWVNNGLAARSLKAASPFSLYAFHTLKHYWWLDNDI